MKGVSRRPPEGFETIELCRWLNGYLGTNIRPWELGGISEWWIKQILVAEETGRLLREVGAI